MSGLSPTLAVMLITSLAYMHASAQRGCVGGRLASRNRRGASRRDAIPSSSVMAIRRSTTPSCFGEPTGVYSRRMPRALSIATNSGLTNSVPLSERRHSTMDGTPLALMSARKPAKATGTSDLRFKKYGQPILE